MRRSAFAVGLGLVVSACGPAARAPASRASAPAAARVIDPLSQSVPSDASAVWLGLPGCDRATSGLLAARLETIEQALLGNERGLDPRAVDAEFAAAWTSPCLAHVARFSQRPEVETWAELRELWGWRAGLHGALVASNGSLFAKRGERFYVVPPSRPPPVPDELRRALAPWICGEKETSCGNAQSFVRRAESAFDAEENAREAWHAKSGYPPCDDAVVYSSPPNLTPFERWVQCVVEEAPRTYRYPKLKLRAPERGWLILRGRRGHYAFADEVRAYDLATGAAYVARSESSLVLSDLSIDVAGTDAGRKLEAFTGNVLPELVREVAFALLTARAPRPMRSRSQVATLPVQLQVSLSPGRAPGSLQPPESSDSDDDQTEISYELTDDAVRTHGHFTWPSSSVAAETHADELLEVLEAGLERGCAHARLPPTLAAFDPGGVSPFDADPASQAHVARDLGRALEGLRPGACLNAR